MDNSFLFWIQPVVQIVSIGMLVWISIQWVREPYWNRVTACPIQLREIIYLVAVLYLSIFCFGLLAIIFQKQGWLDSFQAKTLFPMIGQSVVYLIFLVSLWYFLRKNQVSWTDAFGFRRTLFHQTVATAIPTLLASLFPLQVIVFLTRTLFQYLGLPVEPQAPLEFFRKLDEPQLQILFIFLATIGAPIMEELLFRGLLYPYLKGKIGTGHALWISSFVFAVFHFHPLSIPPLFALSIVLVLLYEWKGNLASCIVMHSAFNALSLCFSLMEEKI